MGEGGAPRIGIVGASGATGALVAEELARAGHPLLLVARRLPPLERLADRLGGDVQCLAADVHASPDLDAVLDRAGVIVDCAGPFRPRGTGLAVRASAVGCPVVDVAGEAGWVEDLARDLPRDGAPVVPAAAVEGGLAELALAELAGPDDPVEATVWVAARGLRFGPGSLRSAVWSAREQVRDRRAPGAFGRTARRAFGAPFGTLPPLRVRSATAELAARSRPRARVEVRYGFPAAALPFAWSGPRLLARAPAAAVGLLDAAFARAPAPSPSRREAARARLVLRAAGTNAPPREATIDVVDPHATSARLAAAVAAALAEGSAGSHRGLTSPAQVVGAGALHAVAAAVTIAPLPAGASP